MGKINQKTIKIAGIPFTLVLYDDWEDIIIPGEREPSKGYVQYEKRTIHVYNDPEPVMYQWIFWHEVLHALAYIQTLNCLLLEKEEEILHQEIDRLALGLAQTMIDNNLVTEKKNGKAKK